MNTPTKFVIEYFDDNKKLSSRWHYNKEIFANGPILVEEFNLPPPEKKKRSKKKVGEEK